MMRYRHVHYLGARQSQSEALRELRNPAEIVLVERGIPRSVVMKCPDGCGEILTINLDRRTGKAWRFYDRKEGVSLYPSVWRTTGCRSHFVVWENGIYWNDGRDVARSRREEARLVNRVAEQLRPEHYTPVEAIADELGEVPWAVAAACRRLVAGGLAEEGQLPLEGHFKLLQRSD